MSRRIKMRYTADEITNNLYTIGGELMTTDRQEYIGLYHTYETGEIFSLPKWNARKSQKLIPYKEISNSEQVYQELKPKLQTSYDSITPLLLEINEQNRIDGYVDRYFLQNIVTKYITEVDNSTFKKLSSSTIDPNLYKGVELRWYITGELIDITTDNVLIPSVQNKNNNEISIAAKTIPQISKFLNNPLEYYSDIQFIVPKDINQLDI